MSFEGVPSGPDEPGFEQMIVSQLVLDNDKHFVLLYINCVY